MPLILWSKHLQTAGVEDDWWIHGVAEKSVLHCSAETCLFDPTKSQKQVELGRWSNRKKLLRNQSAKHFFDTILQRRTRGRKWKKTLYLYLTNSENYIEYYIQVAKTSYLLN